MVPAASVGEPRVVDRLMVVKSWSRTLMVTVRPASPLARNRSATLRAWRVSRAAISRRSVRSVS